MVEGVVGEMLLWFLGFSGAGSVEMDWGLGSCGG